MKPRFRTPRTSLLAPVKCEHAMCVCRAMKLKIASKMQKEKPRDYIHLQRTSNAHVNLLRTLCVSSVVCYTVRSVRVHGVVSAATACGLALAARGPGSGVVSDVSQYMSFCFSFWQTYIIGHTARLPSVRRSPWARDATPTREGAATGVGALGGAPTGAPRRRRDGATRAVPVRTPARPPGPAARVPVCRLV